MTNMLMNKVLLNQLTETDLDALRANSTVMNKVHNHMLEDTKDVVDGVMFPLEGVNSYSISYSKEYDNYINLSDNQKQIINIQILNNTVHFLDFIQNINNLRAKMT